MFSKHKRLMRALRTLSIALTVLLSSACTSAKSTSGQHGDTLFVGVAVGLTNPARYVNVFEGVQMALDELNRSRPGGSAPLALRRAPSGATSAVAVAVSFRDDPDVIGVVGHTESAATISAGAVYADRANAGRNAIVAVSPTAGAPEVTRASEWVFRVCPTTMEQARALARYMSDSLHVRRSAVLYRNDASGVGILRAFNATFSNAGGSVTERDPFTEDIAEFDAYARRIVKTHAEGIVIAGNTTEEGPFVNNYKKAGGTGAVLGTNPPEQSDTAMQRELRGVRFLQLFSAAHPPTKEGERFVAAFREHTGRTADRWAALGYDAAMLIGKAAQEHGRDRHAIRDWIASVGGTRPAYSGVSGAIAFDENRDPRNKVMRIEEAGQ
jgi:branched-chain amino acid transport system substrate-binding protein